MNKTEQAIKLRADRPDLSMLEVCKRVGISPTTVYAKIREQRKNEPNHADSSSQLSPKQAFDDNSKPERFCPLCRGEIPEGHRLQPVTVTVPGEWLDDWPFVAQVLDGAGIPLTEDFPKGKRVEVGSLEREDDAVRGVVRFTWRT